MKDNPHSEGFSSERKLFYFTPRKTLFNKILLMKHIPFNCQNIDIDMQQINIWFLQYSQMAMFQ